MEVEDSREPEPPKPSPPVLPTPIGPPIGTLRVDGSIDLDASQTLEDAMLAAGPDEVILLRADHELTASDHKAVERIAGEFDRTVMVEGAADE